MGQSVALQPKRSQGSGNLGNVCFRHPKISVGFFPPFPLDLWTQSAKYAPFIKIFLKLGQSRKVGAGCWRLEAAGGCGGLLCPPATLTEGTPQQSRQLWLLLSFRCSWKTGTGKGIKREREGLETLRASPPTPGVTRGPAWHHVTGEGDFFGSKRAVLVRVHGFAGRSCCAQGAAGGARAVRQLHPSASRRDSASCSQEIVSAEPKFRILQLNEEKLRVVTSRCEWCRCCPGQTVRELNRSWWLGKPGEGSRET